MTATIRARATTDTRSARRRLILVNGGFLAVVGAVQVAFELASYYAGAGPYGSDFEASPYTIGWVEAHGLALLIGVLFLTVAAGDGRRFWHVFAIGVHVLLGAANIVFWSSFTTFGMVPLGVAATAAHVVFVLAHATALMTSTPSTERSAR